jgi:hypothetical protein
MDVSGQVHAPAALPPVQIEQEAGCVPESLWTRCRGKKSLAHLGFEPRFLGRLVPSLVRPTLPTDLSQIPSFPVLLIFVVVLS